MGDRPHLTVVGGQQFGGQQLGGAARRILFERAHPEVTIVVPVGLMDRWRAIVPLGKIPGCPDETTIGSYDLGGLMDELDEIYPPGGEAQPG